MAEPADRCGDEDDTAETEEETASMDTFEDRRPAWRRRLPGLVMISTLAVVAATVWTGLLRAESAVTGKAMCPPAPESDRLTPVPRDALRDVAPLPPGEAQVRVRNSTDRHRLAARVTARLRLLGFAKVLPPDNDTVYPTDAMRCVGQIRFGVHGRAAARTLSMTAPCMQLVRDDTRTDGVVHLVVGTEFSALTPGPRTRDVLEALRNQESASAPQRGGLQSAAGPGTTAPAVPEGETC